MQHATRNLMDGWLGFGQKRRRHIFGTQVTSNAIAAKIMHMIMSQKGFSISCAWLAAWAIRFQFLSACCWKGFVRLIIRLTDGSFVFGVVHLRGNANICMISFVGVAWEMLLALFAVAFSVWKLFALLWFSLFICCCCFSFLLVFCLCVFRSIWLQTSRICAPIEFSSFPFLFFFFSWL